MKFAKLLTINYWKTIFFNFHYFPFMIAIRMPIFVYWRSNLYRMKGKVIIDAPIKTGMIHLGPHGLGTQDVLYSRTIWNLSGILIFKGKAEIGRGSKISVGENSTLTLGDNFLITGDTEIICDNSISFGNDCLLSWDVLIMDTDFHQICDKNGCKQNCPRPIVIGNHVWIGCRNVILKGVTIADNNVISANSTITRNFLEENCIIGGHGRNIEVIKKDIEWKR